MKSAALIYNGPVKLLIYVLHGEHLYTLSCTPTVYLSPSWSAYHFILSLSNLPPLLHCLPPLIPQALPLYLDAVGCPAGFRLCQPLFSRVVMWSAHSFSTPPPLPLLLNPLISSSPLSSCSRCFCISHPRPDFNVTQKSGVEEKLLLCVRLT